MKTSLELIGNMKISGTNSRGHVTLFDAAPGVGGDGSAASPMEVMLQSMGGCSFMDVVSILRKKRKTIDGIKIEITGERRDEHPKIFTEVHLKYILQSPDTQLKDLERAAEMSQEKYCGAAAMFKMAGCKVTWEAEIQA